jgi:teichuronic acid biosynthesis glycosyltransferase TuaC
MPPPEQTAGTAAPAGGPHVVVFSGLFPSSVQPGAGLFVRERMFRVGRRLPLAVVAPTPWFPLQGLLTRLRPGFRPGAPRHERQSGFDVFFPRFFSTPGVLKRLDGWLMAAGALPRLRALQRAGRLDILDAHFVYPDCYAAVLAGRRLGVPVTITMRGTEQRLARDPVLRPLLTRALQRADRVFAVSESLRQVALGLGVAPDHVRVVGNGVDIDRFRAIDRSQARGALGLQPYVPVLISVGGLCERKGFHRVIEQLPGLRAKHPGLRLLVVGGPSPEGDWTDRLQRQVAQLALRDAVVFTGPVPAAELHKLLSAADVFVLATRNEGWANVLLEAMACGLPVVTTDVGGNAEVVCRPELGALVPFGEGAALAAALDAALRRRWDRTALRAYAQANTWERRVADLEREFRALFLRSAAPRAQPVAN